MLGEPGEQALYAQLDAAITEHEALHDPRGTTYNPQLGRRRRLDTVPWLDTARLYDSFSADGRGYRVVTFLLQQPTLYSHGTTVLDSDFLTPSLDYQRKDIGIEVHDTYEERILKLPAFANSLQPDVSLELHGEGSGAAPDVMGHYDPTTGNFRSETIIAIPEESAELSYMDLRNEPLDDNVRRLSIVIDSLSPNDRSLIALEDIKEIAEQRGIDTNSEAFKTLQNEIIPAMIKEIIQTSFADISNDLLTFARETTITTENFASIHFEEIVLAEFLRILGTQTNLDKVVSFWNQQRLSQEDAMNLIQFVDSLDDEEDQENDTSPEEDEENQRYFQKAPLFTFTFTSVLEEALATALSLSHETTYESRLLTITKLADGTFQGTEIERIRPSRDNFQDTEVRTFPLQPGITEYAIQDRIIRITITKTSLKITWFSAYDTDRNHPEKEAIIPMHLPVDGLIVQAADLNMPPKTILDGIAASMQSFSS